MKIYNLIDKSIDSNAFYDHGIKVLPEQTVLEVFEIMKTKKKTALAVYDGNTYYGVIHLLDITERLISEKISSNQNYLKVIHDVRNPLLNMHGLVNLISELWLQKDHKETNDLLKLFEDSHKHAIHILEDLLMVEQYQSKPLHKQATQMNDFLSRCINEQSGVAYQKKIKIVAEFSKIDAVRNIDRPQFKRAIQNVISNAIKFSYNDSKIKFFTEMNDDKFEIKIVDAGVGIPTNLLSEVFEKFGKAQRPGTGGEISTGLGLCFSKECILEHGGNIAIKSVIGTGTKVYITI